MNTLNKVLIAVLIVQAGIAAYTLTRDDSATIAKPSPVIAGLDAAKVERIDIWKESSSSEDKPAISLARKDDGWVLASHFDYPVEKDKAEGLLEKLAEVETRGPMATSKERQAQLKVADDDYTRKVVVHRTGSEPLTLYLGSPTSAGKNAIRLHGKADIHGVFGLSASSAGTFVSSWVDTNWLELNSADVTRLTVRNAAGELVLERDAAAGWKLAGPAPAQRADGKVLDTAAIDTMVSSLSAINLVDIADPASKPAPLATVILQLEPPAQAEGEAAVSVMPESYTLEISPSTNDGRYIISRQDARPVEVYKTAFQKVVELNQDNLYTDPPQQEAE